MVLKFLAGKKFCENGQTSKKSRNLIPVKFNTVKVYGNTSKIKRFVQFVESFQNVIK